MSLSTFAESMRLVNVDESGIYFEETHVPVQKIFGFISATLIKFDHNLKEVYRRNLNDVVDGGKSFEKFLFIKGKLYLLAFKVSGMRYGKIIGIELNKKNGDTIGDWKELYTWKPKSPDFEYYFKVNEDSSSLYVERFETTTKESDVYFKKFDANLNPVGEEVALNYAFEKNGEKMAGVDVLSNGNLVTYVNKYEPLEGKSANNSKNLRLVSNAVRIYTPKGALIKELNLSTSQKLLTRMALQSISDKETIIAAYYKETRKEKGLSGMMVYRIDVAKGELLSSSESPISLAMNAAISEDENDDGSLKDKNAKPGDNDHVSASMDFRRFIPTSDGGLLIFSEDSRQLDFLIPKVRICQNITPTI